MDSGMVIIGAGEAGARAAEELRKQGYAGAVTLIGQEAGAPYERPPLSKEHLLDEAEPAPKAIISKEKLQELNIRFIDNRTVAQLDRNKHKLVLANEQELRYERLLLATGAVPRKLRLEGFDTSGFLYLRTFADALNIRNRFRAKQSVVVIGGGFIGLEAAASARQSGCEVTVLEVGPRILMRGVPEQIAAKVEQLHRDAGVAFQLGQGISGVEQIQGKHLIRLADGSSLSCDTVIAGIGAIPETSLAAVAGLHTDNGICADATLRTNDPDIFAAGDCCSFTHRLYGGRRLRLESWRNAQDQGIHAAGNMLGGSAAYEAVPWFWSDQYDQTLQVAGLPDFGVTTIKRGGEQPNEFYFHLDAGHRLVAASAIGPGIAKDIRLCEMLIEREAVLQPELLMNPGLKLKSLLADVSEVTS
jgi:3-phenylpropionate/trans-cinnamate dioxygenase ferredoxin reductase subunit